MKVVFRFHLQPFQSLGNFLHPTLCLGRDTKAVGPFYLVCMPGEVKDTMQGNKTVADSLTLEK